MLSIVRKFMLSVGLVITVLIAAACGGLAEESINIDSSFGCTELVITLSIDESAIIPGPIILDAATFSPATFDAEPVSPIRIYDGNNTDLVAYGSPITDVVMGPGSITVTIPYTTRPQANPITFLVDIPEDYPDTDMPFYLALSGDCPELPSSALFYDGRVNNSRQLDAAAPVAIYINDSLGTIDVYAINPETSQGTLVIREPLSTDAPPAENEIFAEATNPFTTAIIRVYRLTSGEYQVVAGYDNKEYSVIFPQDGNSIIHVAG